MTTTRFAILAGALTLGLGLLPAAGPAWGQASQSVPSVTDMPSTGEAPGVLKPQPDLHGRSGQGVGEQHGTDSASPGGTSGVSTEGPTGTGATMTGPEAPGTGQTVPPPAAGQ